MLEDLSFLITWLLAIFRTKNSKIHMIISQTSVKGLVNEGFYKLMNSRSIKDVKFILDDLKIDKKFRLDEAKYPALKYRITKEEVESLIETGFVTKNGNIVDFSSADPLTKILYSILWKNGDLKKIKSLLEGITSEEFDDRVRGLVFYQFGRFLSGRQEEPIIDQHVIRAFGIHKATDEGVIENLRRLKILGPSQRKLIFEYKTWISNELNEKLREQMGYQYEVDKVLFAVGKSVKNRSGIIFNSII